MSVRKRPGAICDAGCTPSKFGHDAETNKEFVERRSNGQDAPERPKGVLRAWPPDFLRNSGAHHEQASGNPSLIACGGSKTVGVTVQTPAADCPCGDAGRVSVEIYSISADSTRGVAVAIFVCGYTLVADRTRRPARAVAISADVLTADPACRIAVPISVGVYGAIAVSACRITRSIRVKAGAPAMQE
jgi:hypothetical protein